MLMANIMFEKGKFRDKLSF